MKRIVIVKRIFNKIFISALVLFSVVNSVISAESEYKNSLMKVELLKQNENSYNINLYTQKKFLEPVKVIKKSDLNYYILLPETKNTAIFQKNQLKSHILSTMRDIVLWLSCKKRRNFGCAGLNWSYFPVVCVQKPHCIPAERVLIYICAK